MCPQAGAQHREVKCDTQHYMVIVFFSFFNFLNKHQQCSFAKLTILENKLGLRTTPTLPVKCIWVSVPVLPASLPGLGVRVKG